MVERPIKKSERQAVNESNDVVDVVKEASGEPTSTNEGAETPIQSSKRVISLPTPAKDKKKEKDRGDRRKDEQANKPPANLALMRGPKPTKPKAPVVVTSPEATDVADATEPEES